MDELLASNASANGVEDDESDGEGEREPEEEEKEEEVDEVSRFSFRMLTCQAAPVPAEESSSSDSEEEEEEEDEDVVVIREQKHDEFDEQAQEEFDREFSRMLADTTVGRKAAPPVFDQAVPMFRKKGGSGPKGSVSAQHAEEAAPPVDASQMQFMLLSKKGNKPQVRSVDIPVDSTIASNVRSHQAAIRAEQEQLKRLVLQNERRLENEDQVNVVNSMRRRGINVRVVNS